MNLEDLDDVPTAAGTVPQMLIRRSDGSFLWMTISEALQDIVSDAPVAGQSLYIDSSGINVPDGTAMATGQEAATGAGSAMAVGSSPGTANATGTEAATSGGNATVQGGGSSPGVAAASGTEAAASGGTAASLANVDLWQDFEFDTVSTANLGAQDHTGEGTWTLSNAAGRLLTGTDGEKAPLVRIGSIDDAGTRGFGYSNSGTAYQPGYAQYAFSGSKASGCSFGFWMKFPSGALGHYSEHDIAALYIKVSAADCYVKVTDAYSVNTPRLYLHNSTAYSSSYVTLSADTWYWIACQWLPNSATGWRCSVYDASGVIVGSEIVHQTATPNYALDYLTIGSFTGASAAGQSGTIWFDDLMIDWTSRTHPLGIPMAMASGTAAAMSGGTVTADGGGGAPAEASDDFNRTNSGTLGADYTQLTGTAQRFAISSNTAYCATAATSGGDRRTAETYSGNHYAECTVGAIPAVRMQPDAHSCYYIKQETIDEGDGYMTATYKLMKIVAGETPAQIGSTWVYDSGGNGVKWTDSPHTEYIIRVEASGTTISMKTATSHGGELTTRASGTDGALSDGTPGLYHAPDSDFSGDNAYFGDL